MNFKPMHRSHACPGHLRAWHLHAWQRRAGHAGARRRAWQDAFSVSVALRISECFCAWQLFVKSPHLAELGAGVFLDEVPPGIHNFVCVYDVPVYRVSQTRATSILCSTASARSPSTSPLPHARRVSRWLLWRGAGHVEPSSLRIVRPAVPACAHTQCAQVWWVRVRTTGPAGHGSRFIENTATEKLHRVITRFLGFRAEQKAACVAAQRPRPPHVWRAHAQVRVVLRLREDAGRLHDRQPHVAAGRRARWWRHGRVRRARGGVPFSCIARADGDIHCPYRAQYAS